MIAVTWAYNCTPFFALDPWSPVAFAVLRLLSLRLSRIIWCVFFCVSRFKCVVCYVPSSSIKRPHTKCEMYNCNITTVSHVYTHISMYKKFVGKVKLSKSTKQTHTHYRAIVTHARITHKRSDAGGPCCAVSRAYYLRSVWYNVYTVLLGGWYAERCGAYIATTSTRWAQNTWYVA